MSESPLRYDGPLRVLVVDADDRVRESLTGLLAIDYRPDVVILDPRLPEVDTGMALIARLRSSLPAVRILVMSWSDTLEAAVIESGADGFVRKTFRPSELVAAVLATSKPASRPAHGTL